MSDSNLALVVSLVASFVIAALVVAWVSERERRKNLTRRLQAAAAEDNYDLYQSIASGQAHPLAAWRAGAGVS